MRACVALVAALLVCGCGPDAPAEAPIQALAVAHFPKAIDPTCRGGKAQIYDECGSQLKLYQEALAEARSTGKVLLISFGAEWCIWCHVFDAHLSGEIGSFRYDLEGTDSAMSENAAHPVADDARALNEFAAKAFVVLHIEADHSPDPADVLQTTGVAAEKVTGLPYIYSVTPEGHVAAVFSHDDAEVRRDSFFDQYRGYDRKALLAQVKAMRDAAQGGAVR